MTVMQFDSHSGWYNPDISSLPRSGSSYRNAPAKSRKSDKDTDCPIASRCFFTLLDQAREGNADARAELKLRGQTTAPRIEWKGE